VGAFLNRIVHAMYAAPSVRQPDDLRGRPVGVTRLAALSGSSARYLLRQWGLEADRDVTVVQTGGFPETLAALSSGAIQAGILPPPHTLRAQELGFVELGNLWTQPLEYPGGMITVRRPSGPEQEERARRMLRALVESIHRLREDRPLAIRVLQAETRIDDPRAVEESYDIYTPLFERDLRLSREAFRAALEELARTNPRAADANADSLMDPRFVDEIRQSGLVERLYAR
jgi:ABC-type nitrate/sulfonate/bicarbonate transport system substrate-binding protein